MDVIGLPAARHSRGNAPLTPSVAKAPMAGSQYHRAQGANHRIAEGCDIGDDGGRRIGLLEVWSCSLPSR